MTERLTAEEWQRRRAGEDAAEAAKHGLTVAELHAARRTGTPPERYAAMKGVRSIEDYEKATARLQHA